MQFLFNCKTLNNIKFRKKRLFRIFSHNIQYQRHHLIFLKFTLVLLLIKCQQISASSSTLMAQQPTSPGVYMVRSPESIVAPKGDEVLFECELNLEFERLEWRFKHANWKSNINEFHNLHKSDGYNITSEEKISKLRIYVSPSTLGDYQCVAWYGSVAIASVTAKLTLASISLDDNDSKFSVTKPRIVTWNIAPRNSVLIKCGNVKSNPLPVWNFFKDNISISQSVPQLPSGALVLNSVLSNSSGIYSCSAINAITGIEVQLPQKIHLNVQPTPKVEPHFLITPLRKFVARPGQTIVLECPGIGYPPPKAIWSSPDADLLNNDRATTLDYGLQILEVSSQDRGNYTCRLDNGLSKVLVHSVQLEVLETPEIIKGPQAALMNESDYLELECIAQGSPQPDIYWMINGKDTRWDELIKHKDGKLIISKLEKRHAGIVQCFAKNEAGETYESNLLQVKPKQIGMQPYGVFPTKSTYDHPGKQVKGRKKHKIPNMIPPSRPNVTRLSDDAVMIRWNVPKNDGLPIQFFKVQYRMLGDPEKKIPRENWQTTNDDIPYGKRDKNDGGGVKNFTSAVVGLKPDRYYRFRIIAVYSNNDNKEGNSSGKFLLQKASQLGLSKSHITAPILTKVEGISETEIVLHWSFPTDRSSLVEGFYAYYRPASTAGEYLKVTIEGMHIRRYKIDMLEPGTAYEFKLQSFTSSTASDFSSILTGRTLRPPTTPASIIPSVIPASAASKDTNSMFPLIAGAAGGGLLLLFFVVVLCFCFKRRKNPPQEDENKPQIDHIQVDGNHFGHPPVISSQHHKPNHRLNGVGRMNITPNPLAQEGDKNRNVMELRFMPTSTGGSNHVHHHNTSTHHPPHHQITGFPSANVLTQSQLQLQSSGSLLGLAGGVNLGGGGGGGVGGKSSMTGLLSSQTSVTSSSTASHHSSIPHSHILQQQQHMSYSSSLPHSPNMLHKSQQHLQQHYLHHQQQQQQQQQQQNNNNHHSNNHFQTPPPLTPLMDQHRRTLERSMRNIPYASTTGPTLDQADGIPSTRIPSLRRTRRTSGNTSNNTGGVGIPTSTGSPRIQRSPMPIRTTVAKRNRLGSHPNNISSGSLNSIEV